MPMFSKILNSTDYTIGSTWSFMQYTFGACRCATVCRCLGYFIVLLWFVTFWWRQCLSWRMRTLTSGHQFAFFRVPPLHAPVLKPDFNLQYCINSTEGCEPKIQHKMKQISDLITWPRFTLTLPTWESLRPSLSASLRRSGLLIYLWPWKERSRPFRCTSENTARRSIPRRGRLRPPLPLRKPNVVPGNRGLPTARHQYIYVHIIVSFFLYLYIIAFTMRDLR